MAKETFYFSHDYNARNDSKIKKLLLKHGMLGYGIFWSIIEDLYNNANALRLDYECIAYDLRVQEDLIKSVINDFDLFIVDGEIFGSKSIETRLNERDAKSRKASLSARKRWDNNANALQTQSDRNAIKEKKVKESKRKESNVLSEKRTVFTDQLQKYLLNPYSKDLLNEFFKYWTEPNKSGTKMRYELERTWDLKLRLQRWASNNKEFSAKKIEENKLTVKSKTI